MEYRPMAKIASTDPIVRAYLECAEWAGLQDEQREALELSVRPTWTPESEARAAETVKDFAEMMSGEARWDELREALGDDRIGHNIYLTQNHHGAGFWDRGIGELGELATKWAHSLGSADVDFDERDFKLTLT